MKRFIVLTIILAVSACAQPTKDEVSAIKNAATFHGTLHGSLLGCGFESEARDYGVSYTHYLTSKLGAVNLMTKAKVQRHFYNVSEEVARMVHSPQECKNYKKSALEVIAAFNKESD